MNEATQAVLWQALGKVASKQNNRDLVETGAHSVELVVHGTVDGNPVHCRIKASLLVCKDYEKKSSTTPDVDKLLAYVLSLVNAQTRNCVANEIRQLPNGKLPQVTAERLELAQELLAILRATRMQLVKGPVHATMAVEACEQAMV